MGLFEDTKKDLKRLKVEYNIATSLAIFSNRGYHSLLTYRISNYLYKKRIPILPLILTRITQIFYATDIDYRAELEGGIVILHGVGLVIGLGVIIKSGTTLYHGVTIGRKKQGFDIPADDGFPIINNNCLLGAGAKILGPVVIGSNCIIGPNCVVMADIADNSTVKFNSSVYTI